MASQSLSDKEILAQLPAAKARSRASLSNKVRASDALVDRETRTLIVVLSNGSRFSVPASKVPGLQRAPIEALTHVTVDAVGLGLHWEDLDVDLSVAGLARVMLGDATVLAAAGSARGTVSSEAKAEAARKNGMKGGRPKQGVSIRNVGARLRMKRLLNKIRSGRPTLAARKGAPKSAMNRRSGKDPRLEQR